MTMRLFILAAALGLALAPVSAPAQAQASSQAGVAAETPPFNDLVLAFQRANAESRFDELYRVGVEMSEHPYFQTFGAEMRGAHLAHMAALGGELGLDEHARALIDRARDTGASPDMLRLPIAYAYQAIGDWVPAAELIIEQAQLQTGALNEFGAQPLLAISRGLAREGRQELRVAMLYAVVYGRRSQSAVEAEDPLLASLIEALAETGQHEQVRIWAARLVSPDSLAVLRFDRRYEFLWDEPGFDALSDIPGATAAEVSRLEAAAQAEPHRLAHTVSLVDALMAVGRPEEAVRVGAAAAERYQDGEFFADYQDRAPWLYNYLGWAYYRLGEVEAGDAALDTSIRLGDRFATDRVSYRINLASQRLDREQYADAAALVRDIRNSDASDFGMMWVLYVQGCAAFQSGEVQDYGEIRAEMTERRRENMSAYADLLACAGDEAGLAEFYLERLRSSVDRAGALEDFQIYLEADNPYSPPLEARRQAVAEAARARPEVMAEVERVGRVVDLGVSALIVGGE